MKRLKILFLVLAILMLSVGITLTACDKNSGTTNSGTSSSSSSSSTSNVGKSSSEGLEYELNEDGQSYYVSGFTKKKKIGNLANVLIPATYNNKPVLGIGEGAFSHNGDVGKVSVEQSAITDTYFNIGESAFEDSYNLQEVSLPDGVREIPDNCFKRSRIKNVSLPNVLIIGENAFNDCNSLIEVDIPNISVIDDSAFLMCYHLERVDFGSRELLQKGPIQLKDYVFKSCYDLERIDLTYVDQIGEQCFYYSGLKEILFSNCQREVSNNAFTSCFDVESIVYNEIPNVGGGFYIVENGCFYDNQNKTLIIGTASDEEGNVIIPDGIKRIYDTAFSKRDYVTSIYISASVEEVCPYAFSDCEEVTSLTFAPDSQLEEIGYWAFSGLKKLASVTLPDNMRYLDGSAFDGCVCLTDFVVNERIERIETGAFDNCVAISPIKYNGTEREWDLRSIYLNNITYDKEEDTDAMINQQDLLIEVVFLKTENDL